MRAPKVLTRHIKNCVAEFPIHSALIELPSRGLKVFYRYEHVCTYRGQEFQNILGRKLCNYFGQLNKLNLCQSKF